MRVVSDKAKSLLEKDVLTEEDVYALRRELNIPNVPYELHYCANPKCNYHNPDPKQGPIQLKRY